jgi:hypothetical protein
MNTCGTVGHDVNVLIPARNSSEDSTSLDAKDAP